MGIKQQRQSGGGEGIGLDEGGSFAPATALTMRSQYNSRLRVKGTVGPSEVDG